MRARRYTSTDELYEKVSSVVMMNNFDRKILIGTRRGIKNKMFDWWEKLEIKSALGHVGLLVTLMTYTAAGGLVSVFFIFF